MPAVATAAPASAETMPWLSLVGRPKYQAVVLQMMTARAAAATVSKVTTFTSTMSLPMVVATAVPESAPARLRTAAMVTAAIGVSTRSRPR